MQEFYTYLASNIVSHIVSQPLATANSILAASALTTTLAIYFVFGGATRLIRSRKNKISELNKQIDNLDLLTQEKQLKISAAEHQIAKLQEAILAEHIVREDNTFALAKKVNELYSLREKELISASKMGELLAEFASNTAQNINVEKSLTSLKALQDKGFIDEFGYERVSAVLVQIYFSSELGLLGKAKKYARKFGL